MTPAELLTDAFERVRDGVRVVLQDLSPEDLTHRPTPDANPIGWLVWHLTRVQDDHVSAVAGTAQAYDDFADRFGLPYERDAIGYGHSTEDVGAFAAPADLLREYAETVHQRTVAFLAGVGPEDLDRVVDDAWDPPVTLGTRLVSVVDDDVQHLGQAAYVRGMLESGRETR